MPGAALNFSVQIHKFLVKALCQRRADGGFSAARHPDDRDIRQLVPQLAADRRMMAAVSSCLPVKCSVANTACATSISKPPAAVTSQSSARSKSSVRKGLYTTSSTASSAGNASGR